MEGTLSPLRGPAEAAVPPSSRVLCASEESESRALMGCLSFSWVCWGVVQLVFNNAAYPELFLY